MFGIGGTELLVILVVALLVLGPKKLPELARTLGKVVGEFRRVSTEFQRTLNTEIALDDTKDEARTELHPDATPQTAAAASSADARTGHPEHTVPDNAAQAPHAAVQEDSALLASVQAPPHQGKPEA